MDQNRHGIVMSLIDGYTLCNLRELEDPQEIFNICLNNVKKLAEVPCSIINHND